MYTSNTEYTAENNVIVNIVGRVFFFVKTFQIFGIQCRHRYIWMLDIHITIYI